MADTVTSQTILNTPYRLVMKFTNVSDGTGESAVNKVDVSTFTASEKGATCTGVTIDRIYYTLDGMKVQILWDASSNVEAYKLLDTTGDIDFSSFGGLQNNAGSGKTGDVLFTTVGHSNTDTYNIILDMTKQS
tara:strand:- start:1039 stop:1437 length:399 start_codon:yes stop_codon:yes gene_type:complete